MKHTYEIRKLEDDGKVTAIERFEAIPKDAKKKAKEYAKRNPGLYSLYKIETVALYFTEKEE